MCLEYEPGPKWMEDDEGSLEGGPSATGAGARNRRSLADIFDYRGVADYPGGGIAAVPPANGVEVNRMVELGLHGTGLIISVHRNPPPGSIRFF